MNFLQTGVINVKVKEVISLKELVQHLGQEKSVQNYPHGKFGFVRNKNNYPHCKGSWKEIIFDTRVLYFAVNSLDHEVIKSVIKNMYQI